VPSMADVESEAVVVRRAGACESIFVFRWEPLGGGVVLLDSSGSVLDTQHYPMAKTLTMLGPDRLSFYYLAGRGSGHWEERFVVLCSMGSRFWIDCLDIPSRVDWTFYGSDTPNASEAGLDWQYRASITVRGDSVIVRPTLETGTPSRPRTVRRSLGTTVHVLP
jgi:hypothetical protein